MDYEEEQAQELEILTSIYTEDEFERMFMFFPTSILTFRNIPHRISNTSRSRHRQTRSTYHPPSSCAETNWIAHFSLHVILPPTYPEAIPQLSLSLTPDSPRSFIPKDQYPEILSKLNAAAEENLGMAMVFTLVSVLKETLEELLISTEAKEKEAKRIADEREKQEQRDEVEEQIRSLRRRHRLDEQEVTSVPPTTEAQPRRSAASAA